jgi:hypothetical protein
MAVRTYPLPAHTDELGYASDEPPEPRGPYVALGNQIRQVIGDAPRFDALVAAAPVQLGSEHLSRLHEQYAVIKRFQAICVDLLFEALATPCHWLSDLVLRDVPQGLGLDFHLALHEPLRHTPRFFRTDQPNALKVAEVQCPGSGWGECALISQFFREQGLIAPTSASLEARFNNCLAALIPDGPVIHHLTDNASSLASNLYFINATRRADAAPKYLGFDKGVSPQACNFVRTHLFEALVAENFGRVRLNRASEGELSYDYPPLCIFEQKLLMALPFLPETRERFDDEIRGIFPWTTILFPDGCTLWDGVRITCDGLANLPRRDRRFFVKYAGSDPSRNWGSRAVYYAGDYTARRLRALLTTITDEFRAGGGCWIIQEAVSERSNVSYYEIDGECASRDGYQKLSAFYGPAGLLGIATMQRPSKKVHGQSNTVMSVVPIEDEPEPDSR